MALSLSAPRSLSITRPLIFHCSGLLEAFSAKIVSLWVVAPHYLSYHFGDLRCLQIFPTLGNCYRKNWGCRSYHNLYTLFLDLWFSTSPAILACHRWCWVSRDRLKNEDGEDNRKRIQHRPSDRHHQQLPYNFLCCCCLRCDHSLSPVRELQKTATQKRRLSCLPSRTHPRRTHIRFCRSAIPRLHWHGWWEHGSSFKCSCWRQKAAVFRKPESVCAIASMYLRNNSTCIHFKSIRGSSFYVFNKIQQVEQYRRIGKGVMKEMTNLLGFQYRY